MKQNLKISYQTFGENNAYLLEGSIKQINHFFNSIYNWEGTNGKLHDMGNGKAFYFYAHPDDVKKALVKVALHTLVNKINAKGRKGGLLEVIVTDGNAKLALTFFNQVWREKELRPGKQGLFAGKITLFNGKRQLTHPE